MYTYLKLVRHLIPKSLRGLIFTNTPIGEKHQWMYDNYSLRKVFQRLGFKEINTKLFNESDIPKFNDYILDIKRDGRSYKGISFLYIEARK